MARSSDSKEAKDTKQTSQTELTPTVGAPVGNTGTSSGSAAGAQESSGADSRAEEIAFREAELKRREAMLNQREEELRRGEQHAKASQSQESSATREAELKRREEQVARREKEIQTAVAQAVASVSGPGQHETATDAEEESIGVLNNSARVIGAPDGTPLVPTQVTAVSRRAWARWFGRDGKPVPGVAAHFSTENGKRADLQEVSLRNLSALPDEHALKVVGEAKDAALLEKFQDTEPREGVRSAISARLKALKAKA